MKYRMFAKSVLGPKYAAKGWRCQDRSGKVNFGRTQVIAVADGHGSSPRKLPQHGVVGLAVSHCHLGGAFIPVIVPKGLEAVLVGG